MWSWKPSLALSLWSAQPGRAQTGKAGYEFLESCVGRDVSQLGDRWTSPPATWIYFQRWCSWAELQYRLTGEASCEVLQTHLGVTHPSKASIVGWICQESGKISKLPCTNALCPIWLGLSCFVRKGRKKILFFKKQLKLDWLKGVKGQPLQRPTELLLSSRSRLDLCSFKTREMATCVTVHFQDHIGTSCW